MSDPRTDRARLAAQGVARTAGRQFVEYQLSQPLLVGSRWPIPAECWLESDGQHPNPVLRWSLEPRELAPEPDNATRLLLNFQKLTDASPEDVRRFARKYGPLHLCDPHQLPKTHLPLRYFKYYSTETQETHRPTRGLRAIGAGETISAWRTVAEAADALIRLALVAHGQLSERNQTWEGLNWLLPEPATGWRFDDRSLRTTTLSGGNTQYPGNASVTHDHATPSGKGISINGKNEAGETMAAGICQWLRIADISYDIQWNHGDSTTATDSRAPHPQLAIHADTLFGALGQQLALFSTRSRGYEFCSNCGDPFTPKARRTRTGNNAYCDKTECRRAISRDAKRREASRQDRLSDPFRG
jgi:hypothetical protein